jgi:TPR repeat protein
MIEVDMRAALRLISIAVGLAAASDAMAADMKQPSFASIGGAVQGEASNDFVAAKSCADFIDEANVENRSASNAIRDLSAPDWRADDKLIAQCRSAADRGDAEAAYALGVMLRNGLGVPQNSAEAAKWLRKSADLGLARAETSLGAMYAVGEGVPQNRAEAMKWTRQAADQGDAVAQYNLGLMYCDGRGEPQDLVQAHMWLNLAAAQGLRQAGAARDQVAAWIGSSSEIDQAQRLAMERGAVGARMAGEYRLRP